MACSHVNRFALLLALSSTSCSLALHTDGEQCATDADCAARGVDFADTECQAHVCVEKQQVEPIDLEWGCIGKVEPVAPGTMIDIELQLLDIITQAPPAGLTIKLCNRYDTPCAAPIKNATMDAEGWVKVTLPSAVEAYLDVTGAGYMPSIVMLDPVATSKNPEHLLVSTAIAESLATTAGVALDPAAAIVNVFMTDCTLAATAGASVTIFPSSTETRFYIISSTTNPNGSQTDSSGNAGFVNVAPGTPTVTGTVGPQGEVFGELSTLSRAGYLTYQILRPTPTL